MVNKSKQEIVSDGHVHAKLKTSRVFAVKLERWQQGEKQMDKNVTLFLQYLCYYFTVPTYSNKAFYLKLACIKKMKTTEISARAIRRFAASCREQHVRINTSALSKK